MVNQLINYYLSQIEQQVSIIGNVHLVNKRKQGLLCSRKCPADKILEAFDLFKLWAANPETTIVSGFHSPVEKECLRLLLKGKANIILSPARQIETMQLSKDWKTAPDEGRMLILSPFIEKRADARTIDRRNHFVADLSDTLYIPYATPGGNLEQFKGEKS
jgi:predicted Rossmann fold nucleotide-binding protein DprA/Smf involved in DNA uptake